MKRILTFLFLFSSLFASSQTQFLGAPNTTIVIKGNMKVDSILYLPKRSKTPTDTGALRYQISDSSLYIWTGSAWRKAKNDGTVTSVGLTMPSAFAVANSPVTSSGTLAVTATGSATEYIRGDGTLGTLPTSGGGGGSEVNYYLNGSVSQGTIGGSTYYEMNKTPVIGAGTDFSRGTDGLIAQFITDANDPNRLLIPAGAWNFELYFSASSAGGTPTFYVELLKYDGTTFTSIASSSANPIPISNGTVTSLYVASLAVTETVLTTTDRLAIRVYTNVSGRTITFHTEDNNLAQVITTFAGGVVSLNGLTANDQFFATGTTGSDFNISSTTATHTFNLPTASATNRGALSSTDWSTFNNKVNISDTAAMLTPYLRKADTSTLSNRINLKLNISDTSSMLSPYARTATVNASIATKVNISDTSTMLTPYLRKVDTTAMLSPYYRTAAATAALALKVNISDTSSMLTNYIRHAGNGLIKTGQALSVDTSAIATRSRVQKAVDSLQANINAKGTGTVTSVATGYGLSGGTITTTGTLIVDTSAIATRSRVQKGIDSLGLVKQNVLTNPVTGTGTNNYVSKWSGTSTQTISQIFDNGTNVGINNASPNSKLEITGTSNILKLNTTAGGGYNLQLSTNFVDGTTYAMNPYISGVNNGGFELLNVTSNRKELVIFPGTGNFSINNSTDAGYKFDIAGILRNTAAAYLATTTGNVGIGNTAPSEKLHVTGRIRATTIDSTATGMNMLYADATGVIKKAAVPSGGGGSVTSITAGTGLTGGTITTSGTIAVDTASIATRARVQKGIDSVTTLANTKLSGTGISGYFPKWTGTSTQDTSQLFQLGRNIGIGTSTPTYRLHLPDANTINQAMIAGTVFGSDGNGQTIKPSNSEAMTIYGQNDAGYLHGSVISLVGRWGVNTTSLSDAVFTVNGDVKIVTIDSTATARNMLYQDANGVIKKSAVPSGLSMADDVMTASGSWVATKDAGSGVTINNVAYTTNGTTKMVTIDGNFYIPETSWTDNAWVTISTIPSGFRPSKTINWNSNFIVSGAEYERADNTDFTGAQGIQGQMRIRDDGTVQINATMDVPTIAAGGTDYIIVTFTQSYIIK